MRYEGDIYRPPSEAYSLLVQVTIGCTHNKCTFCKMFKNKKFRVRALEEVLEDLLLVVGWDADARIADGESPLRTMMLQKNIYSASCRGVFQGVAQQVMKDGIYFVPIYPCVQWGGGSFEGQLQMLFLCIASEWIHERTDVFVHLNGFDVSVRGV